MVVKSEIKHIKKLQQKKYRVENGHFVAEGIKVVSELLKSSITARKLYTTDPAVLPSAGVEADVVTESELKRMSALQSPNKILGVFEIPRPVPPDPGDWILVADAVQDPGNLGTMIRLCDWFGVRHMVCSSDTVDCYNPKALQATMGSIARVNMVYTDLVQWLKQCKQPVYGAYMDGSPLYGETFPDPGLLIVGNEAHGISEKVSRAVTRRITIPQYGKASAESLNVAMATAILLNEVRRPIRK